MNTTEIFKKSYSERLLKIAKNVEPIEVSKKDYSVFYQPINKKSWK